MFLRLDELLPSCDFQERNAFVHRGSSPSQIICELLLGSTTALCDIKWDRSRGAPDLPCEPHEFSSREAVRQSVNRIHKVKTPLIHLEFLEIKGHLTPAKRRSGFGVRSS